MVEAQASASPSLGVAKAEPAALAPLRAPPPPEDRSGADQRCVWTSTLTSRLESGVGQLVGLPNPDTASWEHLVGLYVQELGRTPLQVAFTALDEAGLQHTVDGLGKWCRDWWKGGHVGDESHCRRSLVTNNRGHPCCPPVETNCGWLPSEYL